MRSFRSDVRPYTAPADSRLKEDDMTTSDDQRQADEFMRINRPDIVEAVERTDEIAAKQYKRGNGLANIYAWWPEDPAFIDVILDLYETEHGEPSTAPAQIDAFIDRLIVRLQNMLP
jgi:hypothetical protein